MSGSLPPALRGSLDGALEERGLGPITAVTPLGGGCINHGARLDTDSGASLFVKWNARLEPSVFQAEADGLVALRRPGTLRVPEPIAWGGGGGSPAWLLLEHVDRGPPAPDYDAALGRGLARLHSAGAVGSPSGGFGWSIDNWIGSLPQSNTAASSWASFWRERRIVLQIELARDAGRLAGSAGRTLDALVEAIEPALTGVAFSPALLHGDLWGGNAYAGPGGEPVLIDPAVYVGHGEVDLAMTELFGGFGQAFYRAYEDEAGISAEYDAYLRDLYQLYYLLVHVNLFGGSYEAGTIRAARRVLGAVG